VGSRHYAAADRQGRFALYDAEGRQLTGYRLDSITRLDDRYSFLHQEGRLGLLDHGSSRTLLPAWKTLRLDADGSLHGESFTDWSVFDETFQLSGHLYFDDVEPMDIRLLRVHAGNARAIIDSSGAVISPFTRYDIQPLTPEFFLLSHDRRSGVVNRQGNPILNTEYEQIRWQNGRFLVYQVLDGRRGWCLHDETGSRCGNTVYDDMYWLGGRYFAVKRDKYWGVIDMMGRDVLYCKYDSILAQNNGYFKVNFLGEDGILNERESWEVVPQKKEIELIGPGRYLVRSPYGSYVAWYPNQIEFRAEYYLYPFGEYYLERTDAGKLGLVNAAGARILPPLYDRIWELQEDSLFYARSGEGFTFVTRNGRRLNQGDTRIQDIRPMSEGYIGVRIDGRWGFLDPNGLLRIANRYEDVGPFSEGLAAVRILGRWGFIDQREAIRVQPHYSAVGAFRDGVCRVEINGRHGLIDAGGHLLLDVEYDELRPLEGGGYIAVRDGQMGLVNARGRLLILPRFEQPGEWHQLSVTSMSPDEPQQVLPVAAFDEGLGEGAHFLPADKTLPVSRFLDAADFQSLPLLDHLHELAGLHERMKGAGVEPGGAAVEYAHFELPGLQVGLVDIGDLVFAPLAGLQVRRDAQHLVVVKIQARDGVIGLGLFRLLFDGYGPHLPVEFHHPVALGVLHMIGVDHPALGIAVGLQQFRQAAAVKDVVAQDQRHFFIAHEIAADHEGLRQSVGVRLLGIAEGASVPAAVAQQPPEGRQILGGGDDKDVPDARADQRGQGVIDHGLVVDRHELFAQGQREGMQARTGASGEYYSFHNLCWIIGVRTVAGNNADKRRCSRARAIRRWPGTSRRCGPGLPRSRPAAAIPVHP
jgi:hypothetical protein